MARSVDQCLLELAQLRQDLNRELTERAWSVDKIVIERLQADKVELNLGSIDVRELSGMLSIGFNYGGAADQDGLEGERENSAAACSERPGPAKNPSRTARNKMPVSKTRGKNARCNYRPGRQPVNNGKKLRNRKGADNAPASALT